MTNMIDYRVAIHTDSTGKALIDLGPDLANRHLVVMVADAIAGQTTMSRQERAALAKSTCGMWEHDAPLVERLPEIPEDFSAWDK